jgi:hypothetical protein
MKEYEAVVDLQSFVMPLPKSINPDDCDSIRALIMEGIKQKVKDEEIYLDSYSVEETE